MKKMSIRAKLLLMVVPLVIIGIISAVAYSYLVSDVRGKSEGILYDQLYSVSSSLITADRDFYQAAYASMQVCMAGEYVTEDEMKGYLEDYSENAQQTIDHIRELQPIIQQYPELGTYSMNGMTINACLSDFETHYQTWFNAYKPGVDEGQAFAAQVEAFGVARDDINNMQDILVEYADMQSASLKNSINIQMMVMFIIILLIYVCIVSFVIYMIRYIRSNIQKVTESIVSIAGKDLTENVVASDNADEIGQLSRAAADLSEQQKNLVSTLQNASDSLRNSSDVMSDNTRTTVDSMVSIDSAAGELAHTAMQTATDIESMSKEMMDIGNLMDQSVESTKMLSEECNGMREVTDHGMQTVDGLTKITEQNVKAFNGIFDAINGIDERTKAISTASELITSIASQTNLLSLNASIEAARAGEAGRGFAVVAGEIGQLADQSAQSADSINKMLEELENSAKFATDQSTLVRQYVDQQKQAVHDTREQFEAIVASIGKVGKGVQTLDEANAQLERGVASIRDLLDSLSAASEENAATAQELSATTQSVNGGVQELKDAVDSVGNSAEDLVAIVDDFKI